jgi:hypothetical protein
MDTVRFANKTSDAKFLLGLTQKLFPVSLRLRLLKAVPYSVFVMGVLLILRGMSLGIPYLSPILSGSSCCGR